MEEAVNSTPTPSPLKGIHIMAKPGGSRCNLQCGYCYYRHKADLLQHSAGESRMSDETLETFILQRLAAHGPGDVVFSWQGGEPTLLGLDFFRTLLALQEKHRRPGQTLHNDLQTNGTLLDDEWCRFLRANRFLVGLSIDGPKPLHDRFRRDAEDAGSFDRVLAATRRLRRHDVPFHTLTVVQRENARHPLDVYRFLRREIQPRMMQFIPAVAYRSFQQVPPQHWDVSQLPRLGDPAARPGTPHSVVTDWSVDPDDYGAFLCRVFDEWYQRDYGKQFINLFESAVAQWMGLPAGICSLAEECGTALAIEMDGRVYACDHYVYPAYCRGSIHEQPLAVLATSASQRAFGAAKRQALPRYCRECPYLFACNGECPKNRFILTPDGEPGLNYLCSGLRAFFAHIEGPMRDIVRSVRARQSRHL